MGLARGDQWGPEASSDHLAYQRPIEWDGWFLRSPRALDVSNGSISSKQFLIKHRLKLEHDLSDRLQFRFHFLEERDFEEDRVALPLELRYRFNRRFAVSAFGRPSLYKSENDAGGSLWFWSAGGDEFHLSYLSGDFDRNKRNLGTDRWHTPPRAYTLSWTRLGADATTPDFRRFEAHWEPVRVRSDQGAFTRRLSYHSFSSAGLAGRRSWRLLYDDTRDEDFATASIRARKRALFQFARAWWVGPHALRPGLNFFYRDFATHRDRVIYREILPSVWFDLPGGLWGLGYDATVFTQSHDTDRDRNLEHRLNIRRAISFRDRTTGEATGLMHLLFTVDVDRLGTEETWEGGSVQFRADF